MHRMLQSPALTESAGWSKRCPHTWWCHMLQVAPLGLGGDSVDQFCRPTIPVRSWELRSTDFLRWVLIQDQPFISYDDWWGFGFWKYQKQWFTTGGLQPPFFSSRSGAQEVGLAESSEQSLRGLSKGTVLDFHLHCMYGRKEGSSSKVNTVETTELLCFLLENLTPLT